MRISDWSSDVCSSDLEIAPLDEAAIVDAIDEARAAGIRQIAVSCIFSQLNLAPEERIAALVAQHAPEIEVSLSSDLGRVGFLERHHAAITTASLRPLAWTITPAFEHGLQALVISAHFHCNQNDSPTLSEEHI